MEKIFVKSVLKYDGNKEINEIFQPLLSLDSRKIQIFVHGSWSDNTKTAFSDLDDFIVIEDEYYNLVKHKLDEVEFNFQKRDPLQHHGHWLIKRSQLKQYDNSYMPLFIMKESICLKGDNEISANINQVDVINKTVKRIKSTCKNIELFYKKYEEGKLNIYDLKRFVGSVVLLPPLIYQLKGKALNKRTAILNASLIYSKDALNLIQWSSEFRENWSVITESCQFLDFSNELKKFDSAEKWRNHASLKAPVLSYEQLSSIELNDELIESFINESLYHIDDFKFQRKKVIDYKEAFQKVKNFSIENKAIIVGHFGSIKYPTISDLDVFVCFEDDEYEKGCTAVDYFINSDESLSYLFTHSPLYVCKSMLHDIKYLHTLYDLVIVYNSLQIELDLEIEKEYQDFLNIAWSFLIMQTMNSITKNIIYFDIRTLLLSLKNAQTSVFNLEKKLGINSNELTLNHNTRVTVLKEGLKSRKLVESEYVRVHARLVKVLQELDNNITKSKKEFKISGIQYKEASITSIRNENGHNIIYVNKIFSNLIYNIYKKKDNNSIKYLSVVRKNSKLHKIYGGYINTYIWIVPSKFVNFNLREKILKKLKSVLMRVSKKSKKIWVL